MEFWSYFIQFQELLRVIRLSCRKDATKVLPRLANQTSQRVYKSINCRGIRGSSGSGMRVSNLPTRIEAAHSHLLGKRRLLIVVLVLAIDALVGQFVGFAFHSLFFIGNRVDALIRSCGLR